MEDLGETGFDGGEDAGGGASGGGGEGMNLDDEGGIESFLTFLPPYILCNSTNYTKLPLCNNFTRATEVS